VLSLVLSACFPITRPVLKIALVAPFEGRYRDVGYEVTFAYRLAIQEINRAGGVGGYSIEMLSLDDGGDAAQAAEQARKVAADPEVIAVIGHWLDATTRTAAPIYDAAGIPLLATGTTAVLPESAFRLWFTEHDYAAAEAATPHCTLPCDALEDLSWLNGQTSAAGPVLWQQPQFLDLAGSRADAALVVAPAPLPADSSDPGFADRYRPLAFGTEPRSNAVLAYDATRLVFDALRRAAAADGKATRSGVARALAQSTFDGLSGSISFDAAHNWLGARLWVYRWRAGQLTPP
jgi:ABC-type branched-subunit amino acid transport system substrate-binding protein